MSVRSKPIREVPAEPEQDGSEMPQGWTQCRVGDVFAVSSGGTPSRTEPRYWNGNVPWLSSGDIKTDEIEVGSEFISDEGLQNSTAKLCETGSVVVVVRSGVLKHTLPVALLRRPAAINQDMKCFNSGDADLNHWLALALRSAARDILTENREGTTVQSVKSETLRDFVFPLPPLAEQRRIVGKLELLLGKVSSSLQRLARVPGLLKRFRQSVLAAACSGQLTADWREENTAVIDSFATSTSGDSHRRYDLPSEIDIDEIPTSWRHIPIGNVSDFQQGMQIAKATRSKEPGANRLPILRIGNYANAFADDVDYVEIDDQSLIAEADDVILTRTGETRGKVLTGYRGVFHNNTFRLNFDVKLLDRVYLIYWLQTKFVQEFIAQRSGRSAQPDLTHREFGPCPLALPPVAEQQEIVRRVETLFALADQIEARLGLAQSHVDRLMQSLLAKAFRGELVPTEHALATAEGREYESARQLLDRIPSKPDGTSRPSRKRGRRTPA